MVLSSSCLRLAHFGSATSPTRGARMVSPSRNHHPKPDFWVAQSMFWMLLGGFWMFLGSFGCFRYLLKPPMSRPAPLPRRRLQRRWRLRAEEPRGFRAAECGAAKWGGARGRSGLGGWQRYSCQGIGAARSINELKAAKANSAKTHSCKHWEHFGMSHVFSLQKQKHRSESHDPKARPPPSPRSGFVSAAGRTLSRRGGRNPQILSYYYYAMLWHNICYAVMLLRCIPSPPGKLTYSSNYVRLRPCWAILASNWGQVASTLLQLHIRCRLNTSETLEIQKLNFEISFHQAELEDKRNVKTEKHHVLVCASK